MLKLERIAKTRELSILVRAKTTLFTKTFLFALAYAIFIHVLGLFIFQIAPFKINYQQSTFPPVSVATEIPIHQGVYTTNELLEKENPIAAYLLAPVPERPTLPIASQALPQRNMEYIKQSSPLNNPFLALENQLEPEHVGKIKAPPVSVILSGAIAELEFKLDEKNVKKAYENEDKMKLTGLSTSSIFRFHFNVQVEQDHGQIFWWEMTKGEGGNAVGGTGNTSMQEQAIKILMGLQFTPKPEQVILPGEVEIVFVVNERLDKNND
jgi:hypothetical protein